MEYSLFFSQECNYSKNQILKLNYLVLTLFCNGIKKKKENNVSTCVCDPTAANIKLTSLTPMMSE